MKVHLVAAMSVDGKIAESTDQLSLDWTSKEDTDFFVEKTKEAGVVIMGRKTFDTIGRPLKHRRLIVMTRSETSVLDTHELAGIPDEGSVHRTNLQPKQLVDLLQEAGHEHLVVAGGSSIYSHFLQERLVTDIYLTIEPLLFGMGIPLAAGFERMDMQLEQVKQLGSQSVLLHYKI